jgi:hypothetical protein
MDPAAYNILMEIKSDLGELTAGQRDLNARLVEHFEDDKALGRRIQVIELQNSKQAGMIRVLWVAVTAAGAIALVAIKAYFDRH